MKGAIRQLLVLSLVFSFESCGSGPTGPGGGFSGKLVFVMTDSTVGQAGIYTMNVDGAGLRPAAVTGDTIDFLGTWGEKYILGVTTGPSLALHPEWSPDGRKIVCQLTWAFEGHVIMVMNADGSDKHVLWNVRSAAELPRWSPSGKKILFERHGYAGAFMGMGVVDSNGENDRDFQFAGSVDPYVFQGDSLWFVGGIQWGKDDNMIYALASVNKDPSQTEYPRELNVEIYSIDAESGNVLTRVTRNDLQEWSFRLSPDGQSVVYPGDDLSKPLNVLSLSGNTLTELVTGGDIDLFFNWSNDSRLIVFSKDEYTNPYAQEFRIYIVDTQKPTENRKLTRFKALQPSLFVSVTANED